MNMVTNAYVRKVIVTALVTAGVLCYGSSYASEKLLPGNQYKIIGTVYLMVTYDSLNERKVSKETAHAYLNPARYVKKSFVAFQYEVPVGTVMTIVEAAPKVWHLPFLADRYFVRLDPDPSRGLDTILELNRGMEGSLDGLNPGLFSLLDRVGRNAVDKSGSDKSGSDSN